MPEITQEAILTIILVAIIANLVVAVALLVSPRFRARRGGSDRSAESDRQELLRAHLFGGPRASERPANALSGQFDPMVDARSQIRVSCKDRTVLLEGAVLTERQKVRAELDAWSLFGVARVVNHLEVTD